MKPEESAPAANLTVAQLGKVLTKPAPSQTTEGKPAAPVTSREPLPAEGAGAEGKPPVLSQTAIPNEDDDEGEGQAAEGEGEGQGEEAAPEGEGQEAGDASQPASVSEVVTNRLNTELQPLIEELTKAGAKGALQILQKRIPKLVDQRDTERNGRLTAEQRVTELETELETAKTAKPESNAPQGVHPEVARLSKQIGDVDGFIRLLRANPDGVTMPDGEGGEAQLTADEVSEHLDKLRDRRTELLTERKLAEQTAKAMHAQAYRQIHAKAVTVYPWLAKADAPEQTRMKKILEAIPGLKDLPDHELMVARYFRGMAAEQAEAAQPKKPATSKAPPSREPTQVVTETPGTKSGAVDGKSAAQKAVKEAEAQFKKTGRKEDLQKVESAKQKLRRLG